MAVHPTTILRPLLALLSLYAAQKSYIAITNLQQYEERTEKAAKHLDKAAHDLYKTRVTQASGAGAVCTFFVCCESCVSIRFRIFEAIVRRELLSPNSKICSFYSVAVMDSSRG